jgi:outer membrane biogenesis lipoprotein LolB
MEIVKPCFWQERALSVQLKLSNSIALKVSQVVWLQVQETGCMVLQVKGTVLKINSGVFK